AAGPPVDYRDLIDRRRESELSAVALERRTACGHQGANTAQRVGAAIFRPPRPTARAVALQLSRKLADRGVRRITAAEQHQGAAERVTDSGVDRLQLQPIVDGHGQQRSDLDSVELYQAFERRPESAKLIGCDAIDFANGIR